VAGLVRNSVRSDVRAAIGGLGCADDWTLRPAMVRSPFVSGPLSVVRCSLWGKRAFGTREANNGQRTTDKGLFSSARFTGLVSERPEAKAATNASIVSRRGAGTGP
jgi:hypothetical protein